MLLEDGGGLLLESGGPLLAEDEEEVVGTLYLVMPSVSSISGGGRTRPEKAISRFNTVAREASVLRIAGTYITVEGPTTDQLALATEVYLGGHDNVLTDGQADALEAAGYTTRVG